MYPCILGSRNTRTYKYKRIHFEHICCLEKKKNILFLLCPEKKNFWLSDSEKKISGFLSEENSKKIFRKNPRPSAAAPTPRPPENQMVRPLRMFAGFNYLFKLFFLHLFFASKIYNKTFNTKIAIG